MKKIFLLLFLSMIFLSACARTKPLEAEDVIPSLKGYKQAQEIKKISEDRMVEAEKIMNEE